MTSTCPGGGRAGQTVKPVLPYPDSRLCVYLLHLHPHGVCRNGCKLTVVTFLGWSNCQSCAALSRFLTLSLCAHSYVACMDGCILTVVTFFGSPNCQTCAAHLDSRLCLFTCVSSSSASSYRVFFCDCRPPKKYGKPRLGEST